jgi:phosphoribosylamine-glycine ligase
MLQEGKYGSAGDTVVIEDHLKGIEVSAFLITDGDRFQDVAGREGLQAHRRWRHRPEHRRYGCGISCAFRG